MTSINLNALNFFLANIQFPKFILFLFQILSNFNLKSRAKLFQVHFYQTTVIKWNFGTRNHLLKGNGTDCAVRRLPSSVGDFSFAECMSHAHELFEGKVGAFRRETMRSQENWRCARENVANLFPIQARLSPTFTMIFMLFRGNSRALPRAFIFNRESRSLFSTR